MKPLPVLHYPERFGSNTESHKQSVDSTERLKEKDSFTNPKDSSNPMFPTL